MDLPQFGRRHVFLRAQEGGRFWTGISDRGKSPLAKSQTRFGLNLKKGRKHYGDTFLNVNQYFISPSLCLLPSLTFLHTEWGRGEKKQRELETGLQNLWTLLTISSWESMLTERNEEQSWEASRCRQLLPHSTRLLSGPMLWTWSRSQVQDRCGASCGEQGPHSWILCPLECFVCETDHRKGLCDAWDWEIGHPSRQIGKQF